MEQIFLTTPIPRSFQTGNQTIMPSNELIAFQPRFGVAYSAEHRTPSSALASGLFSDLYPGTILSPIDTNFPEVNLWTPGGSLAWDLELALDHRLPSSGVQLVQQCNSAFTNNYNNGGNLNYL